MAGSLFFNDLHHIVHLLADAMFQKHKAVNIPDLTTCVLEYICFAWKENDQDFLSRYQCGKMTNRWCHKLPGKILLQVPRTF